MLQDHNTGEYQTFFCLFKAFGPDASQEEVYEATTKKLVENVLQGYNATVFAYGATGKYDLFIRGGC